MLFKPGPTLRICFQFNSTFSLGNKTTFGGGNSSFESLSGDLNGSLRWLPFVHCEFNGTYFFFKSSYCWSGLDAGLNSILCSKTFLEDDTSLASRSEASLFAMSESFEKFVTEGITWTATELISHVGDQLMNQAKLALHVQIFFFLTRQSFKLCHSQPPHIILTVSFRESFPISSVFL